MGVRWLSGRDCFVSACTTQAFCDLLEIWGSGTLGPTCSQLFSSSFFLVPLCHSQHALSVWTPHTCDIRNVDGLGAAATIAQAALRNLQMCKCSRQCLVVV